MPPLSRARKAAFQKTVWDYFGAHKRDMPWRRPEADGSFDPYKILVSEVMLQQTQVSRVTPKFDEFIRTFPDVQALASASLGEVLKVWSGLGYNRRAKFLWQTAQMVAGEFGGQFPTDLKELQQLPGVGVNTAGAILVYAFNQPELFVETNIRTVFIHHFFQGQTNVTDADVRQLLEQTLPSHESREWYWALMDYGAFLKASVGNCTRASKHYAKQPTFQGSRRQVRGQVLHLLTQRTYQQEELRQEIADERLQSVLDDLADEKLIQRVGAQYQIFKKNGERGTMNDE